MTENDIFTKLQKIISSKMGAMAPIDSITMDSDLYHDLDMDSLDLYSILPTIEKEFDIPAISPSELDTLQTTLATKPTIRTLVNIVYKKLPTQRKKIERPEPKPTTPIDTKPKSTDIPNTEYLTITQNGVFIDGKSVTYYRGEEIFGREYVKIVFRCFQEIHPEIAELHVLASETEGKFDKYGTPSPKTGPHAWCRIKLKDGQIYDWVYAGNHYISTELCIKHCAHTCAFQIDASGAFCETLLMDTVRDTRLCYGDMLTKNIPASELYPENWVTPPVEKTQPVAKTPSVREKPTVQQSADSTPNVQISQNDIWARIEKAKQKVTEFFQHKRTN